MLALLVIAALSLQSAASLKCWSCDGERGCFSPTLEQCAPDSQCYSIASALLIDGPSLKKGCASGCLEVGMLDGQMCQECSSDRCNDEKESVAPNGYAPPQREAPPPRHHHGTHYHKRRSVGGGAEHSNPQSQQPNPIGGGVEHNNPQPHSAIGGGVEHNNPQPQQPNPIGGGVEHDNPQPHSAIGGGVEHDNPSNPNSNAGVHLTGNRLGVGNGGRSARYAPQQQYWPQTPQAQGQRPSQAGVGQFLPQQTPERSQSEWGQWQQPVARDAVPSQQGQWPQGQWPQQQPQQQAGQWPQQQRNPGVNSFGSPQPQQAGQWPQQQRNPGVNSFGSPQSPQQQQQQHQQQNGWPNTPRVNDHISGGGQTFPQPNGHPAHRPSIGDHVRYSGAASLYASTIMALLSSALLVIFAL